MVTILTLHASASINVGFYHMKVLISSYYNRDARGDGYPNIFTYPQTELNGDGFSDDLKNQKIIYL